MSRITIEQTISGDGKKNFDAAKARAIKEIQSLKPGDSFAVNTAKVIDGKKEDGHLLLIGNKLFIMDTVKLLLMGLNPKPNN